MWAREDLEQPNEKGCVEIVKMFREKGSEAEVEIPRSSFISIPYYSLMCIITGVTMQKLLSRKKYIICFNFWNIHVVFVCDMQFYKATNCISFNFQPSLGFVSSTVLRLWDMCRPTSTVSWHSYYHFPIRKPQNHSVEISCSFMVY